MRTLSLLLSITWLLLFIGTPGFTQEIFEAIQTGNLEKVKTLVKADPNLLNSTKENGDTPLHWAAYAGKKDIVGYLLTQNAKIDKTNKGNATALIYAVYFGHKEVAEVLLDYGAECNTPDDSGRTSLHYAASSGRLDIIQLLLSNDAETDISASGYYETTALHLAIKNDHIDIANLLIEKSADINIKDIDGWSSLHWSLNRGNTDMVRQLISMGADIHLFDKDGKTPVRLAVEYGYDEIVNILHKKGADLTELEEYSMRTLLHSAAINGYLNIVEMLISKGANIDVKDKFEKTPLFYANKCGHYKVADLLMKHGAKDESVGNNYGKTTLSEKQLEEGEAVIWYLGHCGWAIKTKNHFLIFDYWQHGEKPDEPSLLNGHINPDEIIDSQVYVFVSHQHYDHFDKVIFEWEKTIKKIKYILGWPMENMQNYIYIKPGEQTKIDNLDIVTESSWDDVPNQGFLVKTDGIVIYHSGDDDRDDMDILIPNTNQLDLLFQIISRNEGEGALLRIKKLAPKVTFPMHWGGREYRYKEFAELADETNVPGKIICAENRGDIFVYSDGHQLNK